MFTVNFCVGVWNILVIPENVNSTSIMENIFKIDKIISWVYVTVIMRIPGCPINNRYREGGFIAKILYALTVPLSDVTLAGLGKGFSNFFPVA